MAPPKTPNALTGSNPYSSLVCEAEPVVTYDETAGVCSLDGYTPPAAVAESPLPDYSSIFRARHLARSASILAGDWESAAFGGAAPRVTSSDSSPLAAARFSPFALAGIAACANTGELDNAPPIDPEEPPTENPPINPIPDSCGIGTGINTNFVTGGACTTPYDLDPVGTGGSFLLTCGTRGAFNETPAGMGLLELIAGATGNRTALQLPTSVDGSRVRLVSSAPLSDTRFFTGFAAAGTKTNFESGDASFNTSGIFTVNPASAGSPTITRFQGVQTLETGSGPISYLTAGVPVLGGAGGTTVVDTVQGSIDHFTPNTPVGMTTVGNTLYVLTSNPILNPNAVAYNATHDPDISTVDYAPATLLRYTINADGSLAPIASPQNNFVPGTTTASPAFVLGQYYNPTAIAALGTNRIATLIQGVPVPEGASGPRGIPGIYVLNNDLTPGLAPDPLGDGDSSFVPLLDTSDPTATTFVPNNASNLAIASGRFALVGSGVDGRVAVADLNSTAPDSGVRTRFVTVFDDGSTILDITVRADGNSAEVLSSSGMVRVLRLDGSHFGEVCQEFTALTSVPSDWSGPRAPMASIGNTVLIAGASRYAMVPRH